MTSVTVPLVGGSEQDLVDVHPLGHGEGPQNALGDVLGLEELQLPLLVHDRLEEGL